MRYFALINLFAAAIFLNWPAYARDLISVHTPFREFKVERFAERSDKQRPAVIVLGGSKGFASPAYDEIGNRFRAAGLDVYLTHLLSQQDLKHIADAKDARSRIDYYDQQRKYWIGGLHTLVTNLKSLGYGGRIGIMGISLGAETAAIAASQGLKVDAVVLVDGVSPPSLQFSTDPLPPFHLIWGGADAVFPLASAKRFQEQIKRASGTVTMTVTDGAKHDFFLSPETQQANAAYEDAIRFLVSELAGN